MIGIDGTRPDALMASDTPAIDALVARGCITLEASTSMHTVSGPGWSTVLCGVWPDKHRSVDNRFLVTDYERYPSLFTLAKRAQPAIRTAYFGNWGPIGERILAKDPIDVRVSLQDTKNDAPQTEACIKALAKDDALDLAVFGGPERGLLGIAVHPGYPQQPYVYLYYTPSATGGDTLGPAMEAGKSRDVVGQIGPQEEIGSRSRQPGLCNG